MNNKPINMIIVLCDPKRVQRIALTCKCDNKWTELIPQELHDSELIAQFECPKCGQLYRLHRHQLIRVNMEDAHDKQTQQPFTTIAPYNTDKRNYDS